MTAYSVQLFCMRSQWCECQKIYKETSLLKKLALSVCIYMYVYERARERERPSFIRKVFKWYLRSFWILPVIMRLMSKGGTENPWFFQPTCIFEQYRYKFKSIFYK